jgi:Rrf2 family protein
LLALMSIARRNGHGDVEEPPAHGSAHGAAPAHGITACEIADATGVPVEYLRKIMQRLAHARIVRSERGRAGGFRLRRPANRVNLLQVVEAIEGPIDEIAILDDPLLHSSNDPVHQHLKRWRHHATIRLRDMLRQTTLEDMLTESPVVRA